MNTSFNVDFLKFIFRDFHRKWIYRFFSETSWLSFRRNK